MKMDPKAVFIIQIVVSGLMPLLLFAQHGVGGGIVPCGGAGQPGCDLCQFVTLVNNLVQFLWFYLMLPAGIIGLMVCGFYLLTAGGNPEKISKGKKAFWGVIIGLLIAFAAWLIIDTILRALLNASFGPWNDFPSC